MRRKRAIARAKARHFALVAKVGPLTEGKARNQCALGHDTALMKNSETQLGYGLWCETCRAFTA